MKVGEQVDKKETIKNIINNNDGIAKTADFVSEGLSNYDVANLCKEGYIERVRHGYYQLAEQEDIKEEQVLASLLPVFFASTFSSKMQIEFLKVAWGISPVLHFLRRHSFRCRRGAVAGIQSLLVTDM